MILLMLRTAPSRDGSPAPATRRMGRTLRTLVLKLDTKKLENKPKRHDSKYIYTGQTLWQCSYKRHLKITGQEKQKSSNNTSHLGLTLSKLKMKITYDVIAVIYY